MSEWLSSVIPRIPSGNREQSNESAREAFKVDIVIHGVVPFDLSKVYHSNYRVDVHKQKKKPANVRQLLHCDHERIEYQIQTFTASFQEPSYSQNPERPYDRHSFDLNRRQLIEHDAD